VSDWNTYAYIKEDTVYLKGFLDYPDRELAKVNGTIESTIEQLESQFNSAGKKVTELESKINEARNKGAYLMKLRQVREDVLVAQAIGDFEPLLDKLNSLESYLLQLIHENRLRNLSLKETLLQELKAVDDDFVGWNDANEKVIDIKQRWIRTGAIPEENSGLEEEFKNWLDDFYERKSAFYEDKRKLQEGNIAQLESIIARAEALLNADTSVQKAKNAFKKLQQEWREAGRVPREAYQELLQKFRAIGDSVFKKNAVATPARDPAEVKQQIENWLLEARAAFDAGKLPDQNQIKELRDELRQLGKLSDKALVSARKDLLMLYDKMREWNFVKALCEKKVRGYDKLNPQQQTKAEIRYLNELIKRDRNEVENYEENAEKFGIDQSTLNTLVNNKLKVKQRNISIKESLLQDLKNGP